MQNGLTRFVNHIRSLANYCFGSQTYQIQLKCAPDEALDNIKSAQRDYGINVISIKDNTITLCAIEHAHSGGSRVGTPIVPVFTGKFVEKNSDVVLTGTIELEFGIKMIMGMFCVLLYIVLPLSWIYGRFVSQTFGEVPFWGPPLGVIVFTCLLEFGYGIHKKDVFCIKNFLKSILCE